MTEGLKALGKIKTYLNMYIEDDSAFHGEFNQYNWYDNVERELRALEIIKTKKLDVCSFINNFVERNDSYETYVLYFEKPIEIDYCVISEELLTEEEFNLVRDVLKGDIK